MYSVHFLFVISMDRTQRVHTNTTIVFVRSMIGNRTLDIYISYMFDGNDKIADAGLKIRIISPFWLSLLSLWLSIATPFGIHVQFLVPNCACLVENKNSQHRLTAWCSAWIRMVFGCDTFSISVYFSLSFCSRTHSFPQWDVCNTLHYSPYIGLDE